MALTLSYYVFYLFFGVVLATSFMYVFYYFIRCVKELIDEMLQR